MFNREPILWLTAVQALIALVTSFGFDLSGTQTGAIMAVSAAVLGLIARQRVSPVVPDAPPHRDAGYGLIETVVLVVLIVLALFGALCLLGH